MQELSHQCIYTSSPLSLSFSLCLPPGVNMLLLFFFLQNEKCIAFGPGNDMFESTKIIATKQFEMGKVRFIILYEIYTRYIKKKLKKIIIFLIKKKKNIYIYIKKRRDRERGKKIVKLPNLYYAHMNESIFLVGV